MARYLSRAELSCMAGKYIEMYYALFGISKNNPVPINPEQFASSVLGLNLKMLPLCSDGHILGLTVFQRCSFTATLEDGTKLVEVFMPRDIVIDSALAADRCTGCRNFTITHTSHSENTLRLLRRRMFSPLQKSCSPSSFRIFGC